MIASLGKPSAKLVAALVALLLGCSDASAPQPASGGAQEPEEVERLELRGAGIAAAVDARGETRIAFLLDVGGAGEVCVPPSEGADERVLSLGVRAAKPDSLELSVAFPGRRAVTSKVAVGWSDVELAIPSGQARCARVGLRGQRGLQAAISTPLMRIAGAHRPWVILYVIDTLRFDYTPFAEASTPEPDRPPRSLLAPAFESLAADGILYRGVFSASSWTRPSVATLLTGLGPSFHRVYDRQDRLPTAVARLPGWLAEQGWFTEALSSNPNVLPLWGFMPGFDRFIDVGSNKWTIDVDFRDLTERVVESFESSRDQPLFLYVHDNEPHSPYRPSPEHREMFGAPPAGSPGEIPEHGDDPEEMREARVLYRASIRSLSDRLQTTFDALRRLGRYDDSLIVLVGDHGEEFGDHGGVLHGRTLYQEQLHVPLVIKPPSGRALPGSVSARLSTESLAATVLYLLDLEVPASLEAPRLPLPGEEPSAAPIYSELLLDGARSESVVLWPWKYLREGGDREQLFDLEADPQETRNLAGEQAELLGSLRQLVDRRRAVASAGLAVSCVAGEEATRLSLEIELPGDASTPKVETSGLDALDGIASEPGRVNAFLQLRPAVEPAVPYARFRASVAARAQPDRDIVRIHPVAADSIVVRAEAQGGPIRLLSPDGALLANDGEPIALQRLSVSVAPDDLGEPETATCLVYYLELPGEVAPDEEVGPELRARLRALGYLHKRARLESLHGTRTARGSLDSSSQARLERARRRIGMSDDVLCVEREGELALVTLNRPDSMNALSKALRAALVDAFTDFERSGEVRVVILTGAGRAFCAGFDLKEMASREAEASALEVGNAMQHAIEAFRGPIIGAVNGHAITGGFELALACDVLVASTRAVFADTHARVGILPGWGLSQRLPRRIGVVRAKEISLTGNFISAEQADEWGLVNRVVEPDELLPTCRKLAEDMLSCQPEALRGIKRLIDEGLGMPLAEAMAWENRLATESAAAMTATTMADRRDDVQRRGREQS